jgi:hypothetical protein
MGFLWSSIDIMEYLYEYEYRGLNSKYKREYFKWSKRLFGTKIRALENKRPKYRKLPIWRKKLYMDNLEHYKQKVYDKKYSIIQSKYSIISRHLLKIVYPSFLNIEGY